MVRGDGVLGARNRGDLCSHPNCPCSLLLGGSVSAKVWQKNGKRSHLDEGSGFLQFPWTVYSFAHDVPVVTQRPFLENEVYHNVNNLNLLLSDTFLV